MEPQGALRMLVMTPKTLDPEKLRAAREAKGWSVDDLEFETRKLGFRVVANTIRNLESGSSGGKIETIGRLAAALGLKTVDELLTDGE